MPYSVALLDPRPTLAATATNDATFALGPTLGIEVTVPALARRCTLGNLDPQHAGRDSSRAAIQDALDAPLPPAGTILVTVRPDLDALGTMAVFHLRAAGTSLGPEAAARVEQIAAADRFAHGPWPGPRPLPSEDDDDLDPEGAQLNAIAALVADGTRSMSNRVDRLRDWLITGETPTEYADRVREERLELARQIATGATIVSSRTGGRIAAVESAHRSALLVGYRVAPVVAARNPRFRFQGREPHVKYTIAQYAPGYVDLDAACAALATRELGWGGSPTIIGSPQGVASTLAMDDVLAEVEHALTP